MTQDHWQWIAISALSILMFATSGGLLFLAAVVHEMIMDEEEEYGDG